MRQRPIFGGVFGRGRYVLATMPTVSRGLHAVRFMVIEPRGGAVLSVAEDKREAIASARRLLRTGDAAGPDAANDPRWSQAALWPELIMAEGAAEPPKVSRRRRAIFTKCEGRCHYCRVELSLHGQWHVEHMQPRALGGTNDPQNLVAACVPCNSAKSDRTALEFVAASNSVQEQN